jgi:16S rRNA (guanine(527)-N(7))-methyltransferase RsmG
VKQQDPLHPTALGVSRETEARLEEYLALLQRWNRRINLVAGHDPKQWWDRHVMDSLQLLPLLPPGLGPLVDLGSGAGFPGLVLAVATGLNTHLVESDRRKCAFLLEAARLLRAEKVQVHPTRIEAAVLPKAGILTARALAPLSILLHHAHSLLLPEGVAIFPKGRTADQELTAAAATWRMRVERHPSRTDPESLILLISEIRPVGAEA